MLKITIKKTYPAILSIFSVFMFSAQVFAAPAAQSQPANLAQKGVTLWALMVSGGVMVIFLGILSIIGTAFIIYHFKYIKLEKLVPQDFVENLLFLLEKKEYEKAVSVCKQQENLVSAIALKGLAKRSKGPAVIENAIQNEGKAQLEKLWQNLNYISDIAALAPLMGLLGTILGMIDAFHYFKAGSVHPGVLTQGLAKAMINTAFGLVVAVPCLAFYSYFRGRISRITSSAESAASEVSQLLVK
jgi:biopolymer transport protein ExbB